MIVGGHVWNQQQAELFEQYPDDRLLCVMRPGWMEPNFEAWWTRLKACSWWVGPSEAEYGRFEGKLRAHGAWAGSANLAPESPDTSPGVFAWQTDEKGLKWCLTSALGWCGYIANTKLVYSPGFTLLCKSFDQWAGAYELNPELIAALGWMLPEGSVWVWRVKQLEFIHKNDPAGFAAAVVQMNALLTNPGIERIVHISAPTTDYFLDRADALETLGLGNVYLGTQPGQPLSLYEEVLDAAL